MIDSNKLLSKNQVSRGRNIVTIKRNLIKINNLLKERLVLTKIRQGIMMQEEENRIRRQREDDLESLEPTRKIEDDKPKDEKKNSGLLAALATLGLLFLPGLKKLLNFLNDIKDRVGNMAKLLLKAMTDFKDKAFTLLNKVNLTNFKKENIQTSFAKLEKDLKNFFNALIFAAAANFAVSTLGKLSGFNIQNLIRRGRKTKVDDVLDDVPVGEGGVPFETGTFRKTPLKVETPVKPLKKGEVVQPELFKVRKTRVRLDMGEKILRDGLKANLEKEIDQNFKNLEKALKASNAYKKGTVSEKIGEVEKALKFLNDFRQGISSRALNQIEAGNKFLEKPFMDAMRRYDGELIRYEKILQGLKNQKNLSDLISKILKPGRLIKKSGGGTKTRSRVKKRFLGGLATLGTYKLGEQGPEFIIDADSTLAIENTAPGFLNALNQAEGFQSIDVLRNYASYEGGHLQTASFFPVFIPSPSNKKSQVMLAVSGGNGSRQTVFSKIHDKR